MKSLTKLKRAISAQPFQNSLRLASNVADGETITIGGVVFEIDTAADPGAITAGNVRVNCTAGVTPTLASAAIVAAINSNTSLGITAVAPTVNEILIYSKPGRNQAHACTETLAGSNNAWGAAAMGGSNASDFQVVNFRQRTVTATDVALGFARFVYSFTPTKFMIQIRSSAGALKTWDGAAIISGNRIDVDITGSSDWAAGDTISIIASE